MAKSKPSDKAGPSFEQAIEQLETIIDQIESGEVPLEECIQQYEKGMKLVTRCRSILDRAEQRIATLTPDESGRLNVSDPASDPEEAGE